MCVLFFVLLFFACVRLDFCVFSLSVLFLLLFVVDCFVHVFMRGVMCVCVCAHAWGKGAGAVQFILTLLLLFISRSRQH